MLRLDLKSLLAAVVISGVATGGALADQTTLNFVGTEPATTWHSLIQAFEAKHKDTHVEYQQIPFGSYNAQIEARIGSQDPSIDVYMADTPRVPTFASRKFLADLSDYQDKIKSIATPTEQTAVSYEGKFFAFPLWTGTQLLFYNRDLLKKAGVEAPDASPTDRLTWKKFLPMANKVQQSGVKYGFTFAQVDRYFQLQPLFESVGAGSGLSGPRLLTPDIVSSGWLRIGKWYQDLYASGLAPRGVAPEQTPDLFVNGQVGFLYGGLPLIYKFSRTKDLNYGVAAVPYFEDGKPVTSTGSWAIGVSPYSQKSKLALEFAEFMTLDPEGATLVMNSTSAVPVNQSVYPKYLEKLGEAMKAVGPVGDILTYEIKNTAVPRPRSVGYVVFEEVMNRAFSDIRNGADVKQTLERAQSQLKSSLARIR